jgi:hypothetical protein
MGFCCVWKRRGKVGGSVVDFLMMQGLSPLEKDAEPGRADAHEEHGSFRCE